MLPALLRARWLRWLLALLAAFALGYGIATARARAARHAAEAGLRARSDSLAVANLGLRRTRDSVTGRLAVLGPQLDYLMAHPITVERPGPARVLRVVDTVRVVGGAHAGEVARVDTVPAVPLADHRRDLTRDSAQYHDLALACGDYRTACQAAQAASDRVISNLTRQVDVLAARVKREGHWGIGGTIGYGGLVRVKDGARRVTDPERYRLLGGPGGTVGVTFRF